MTKIPYSLRIDPDILKCIKKKAKEEFRSVNNCIEVAIKKYCE